MIGEGQAVASSSPKRRGRLLLTVLLPAAAISLLAVAGHNVLAQSLRTLSHPRWSWVGFAVFAQAASMAAFARSQRRLLRAGSGTLLHLRSVMAVTYAGSAISASLPIGGPEVATAFTYRQYNRLGIDPATTAWALAMSAIMSSLSFSFVLGAGSIISRNSTTAALGLSGAFVFVLPSVVVLAALRSRKVRHLLNRLLERSAAFARRHFGRPKEGAEDALEMLLDGIGSRRLPGLQYAEVFGLAVWNWGADALCLAAALQATGISVPWHGLFLAYALAKTAGSTGLTPGGIGIIEPVLASALVAAGVSGQHALAGVLLYRLVSFWLVVAAGWATTLVLTRTANRAVS